MRVKLYYIIYIVLITLIFLPIDLIGCTTGTFDKNKHLHIKVQENTNLDSAKVDTTKVATTISRDSVIVSPVDTLFSDIKANQEIITNRLDSIQSTIITLSGNREANSNIWLLITVILLSILTLALLWVSFYLFKSRRIILKESTALVPERWGKYLENVGENLKKLQKILGKELNSLESTTSTNASKMDNLIETFMTLRNSLDDKEAEIKRLKKGYDSEIYRKFLFRFIRVSKALDELLEDGQANNKDLKLLRNLLNDALLECGVERYRPEIGEDFREADGVSENPRIVYTDSDEDEYKIAEVINDGYVLKNGENTEILVPAEVKVFTTKK